MSGIEDDYGAYDPVQHENQLVAVYEDAERAQSARSALIAAGIPAAAIEVVNQPGGDSTATTGSTTGTTTSGTTMSGGMEDEGFWGAMKRLFAPDDDVNAYHHAVHRGHAMLVVTAQPGMDRNRAIEEIERTDPIDFDAHLQEWSSAGYDYSQRPGATSGTGMGMGAAAGTTAGIMGGTTPGETAPGETGDESGATSRQSGMNPGLGRPGMGTGTAGRQPLAAGMAEPSPRFGETADESGATIERPNLAEPGLNRPATGMAEAGQRFGQASQATPDTIRAVREQLRVGKREVAAGAVRVRSYVVERPVEEQVRLREERVHLERQPVDRPATPEDLAAFREQTIEARATSEEAVVDKEARVVEEIALRKEAGERVETVRDTVRETKVDVEDDTTRTGTARAGTTGTTDTTRTGTTSAPGRTPRR